MQTFDWNQLVTDATVPDSTTSPLATPSRTSQGEDGASDTDDGVGVSSPPDVATPDALPGNEGVALHPRFSLALREALDGQSITGSNVCVVVGTVTHQQRKPSRRQQRADANRQHWFDLVINDVLADEAAESADASLTSLRIPLQISPALLGSGLFTDGATLALGGPLHLDQRYDRAFARPDRPFDLGRPDWTLRLQTVMARPVAPQTPHGSHVQLIGEIDGTPRIRRQVDGPQAEEYFVTVRLRVRRLLKSGFGGSKAQFVESALLPLDVPLNGLLEHAGALLKAGNQVLIHGRLVLYRARRPTSRADVQAALEGIATAMRCAWKQRQPDAQDQRPGANDRGPETQESLEQRIRRAQERFLTIVKPTIQVGYVELRHGTELDDAAIAQLIAERRRGDAERVSATRHGAVSRSRAEPRSAPPSLEQAVVEAALDDATPPVFAATAPILNQGESEAPGNMSDEAMIGPVESQEPTNRLRPRARKREQLLVPTAAALDHNDDADAAE